MTKQKKKPKLKDNQEYLGVAIVFLISGMGLTVSEGTRAAGIPFLVLGITFFILSQNKPAKPKK